MPTRWTRIIIPIALSVLGILLLLSTNTEAKTIEVDIEGGGEFNTIQDGVNASDDGDTVLIHEGEYHEEVNISTSITLKGMEDGTAILTSANDTVAISIGAANVTVRDLVFRNANSGIQLFQSFGTVIENCTFDACRMGISLIASSGVRMLNNTFRQNGYTGVIFFQWKETDVCTGDTLSGNLFDRNAHGLIIVAKCTGLNVHDNAFENNTVSGITCPELEGFEVNATNNWWGSSFGPYDYEENPHGKGDRVIGPIRYDPWTGKEDMLPPMDLGDVYVLGSAPENGNGSQELPFTSIMEAIYHIQPHGSIHVWEGTYFEHLVIRKSMKIIGNGSSVSAIVSGGFGDCVVIHADHVEIRNIRISVVSNRSQSLEMYGSYPLLNSCLRIESSHNTITNCTITDGVVEIDLVHSSHNTISSNRLYPQAGGNNQEGIVLQDGSNDNVISGNTIQDLYYFCIDVRSSDRNLIERNQCSGNQIGIRLSESNASVLDRNDCSNNSGNGIGIENSSRTLISNNTCNFNGRAGIHLEKGRHEWDHCSGTVITSNTCSGNSFAGIDLGDASPTILRMNTLQGSGIVQGTELPETQPHHDIDETNLVNGKPVIYLSNRTGMRVDGNAGQIILNNCTDMIVEAQRLDRCTVGIAIYHSSSITISHSIVSNCVLGIVLHFSDNNTIMRNVFHDNDIDEISGGIAFIYSHNNSIMNNTFGGNGIGMGFILSSNNTIENSIFNENRYRLTFVPDELFIVLADEFPADVYVSHGMNRVHNNLFTNNSESGIDVDLLGYGVQILSTGDGSFVVDARFNWWGSDTGPRTSEDGMNPHGGGDRVSDNVEISPWLTEDGSLRYAPTVPEDDEKDGLLDFLHPMDLLALLIFILIILFVVLAFIVRAPEITERRGPREEELNIGKR